ncbi:MAG: NUDIX hydrolase [Lentisphaeria bacterium]|nr:NUDIX hydrolase [Lentisphaeria bacterium]
MPSYESTEILGQGRFLQLELLTYRDGAGRERKWEAAMRCHNQGAVLMIPVLKPSERYVLIRQYRPPVKGFVIEFPAGLIDPDEAPRETALRELAEETGYTGTIAWMGRPTSSSAGLTGESVVLALMEIDENAPENQTPAACLEEGEEIEVIVVAKNEVSAFLHARENAGDILDSRLAAYFMGHGLAW